MANKNQKASTRLYVLLARKARVGLIFRRGPSKEVLIIKWDLEKDAFEYGQWFKGRIYERRCDLSPTGEKMIYFAANHKKPLYSWTAISKVPFLKALALWPKGDCWNGGGQFITDHRIQLNHAECESVLQPGTSLKGIQIEKYADARGEDSPIYDSILERDGWSNILSILFERNGNYQYQLMEDEPVLFSPNEWERIKETHGFPWLIPPLEIWRKPHPRKNLLLEMTHLDWHKRNGPWYVLHYRILDKNFGKVADGVDVDWADWDKNGDLLFAKGGKLFRQRNVWEGFEKATELVDFNSLKFEAIKAPVWAEQW
jgi:hypothetical protein